MRSQRHPGSGGTPASVRAWLRLWRLSALWHRYTVEGLDHIIDGGPKLIVGYHGRLLAWDLCILTTILHDRLGYLPHGVVHGAFAAGPVGRVVDELGFVTSDGPKMADAVARGEHLLVAPGGDREACRSHRDRYRVDWGERHGYLRLAIRHRLPIVPVAASGVDDTYIGLHNGHALGRRLAMPGRLPVWLAFGPLGLCPFSPPFPARIHQIVGEPIDLWEHGAPSADDRDTLERLHSRVTEAVQALLDRATATAALGRQSTEHWVERAPGRKSTGSKEHRVERAPGRKSAGSKEHRITGQRSTGSKERCAPR